jgi:hypothetical protein
MQSTVRTVYGAYLQTCHYLKVPFTVVNHTTLNEKLNIFSDLVLAQGEVPSTAYFCIGNGGHRAAIGADGVALIEVVQHTPRHAGLYNQLPFVLRRPANDLTQAERAKYRLRRIEYHDSVQYVAYYARVLDLTSSIPQMEHVTIIDGVKETTPFIPTTSDLNPVPPAIPNTGAVVVTGDYLFCSARIPMILNSQDVTEFLNVANIIYGSENYATISEIALCSGIDRIVSGIFNGVTATYTDAIAVQIVNFISAFYSMPFNNEGLSIHTSVGSVEPLLSTVPVIQ